MKLALVRRLLTLSGLAVLAALVGCASPAPNYSPSISNVEALKSASPAKLNVGKVDVAPNMSGAESISLRADQMTSPVGKNFGDYLANAVKQELELAGIYNQQSNQEITATLITNVINAGGLSVNDAQIEARFIVTRQGRAIYDQRKKADMKWESSFAGAVAIPLARNNYPILVQKLLGQLFTDPDFIRAVKTQ
jgi:hypothetical protein